MRAAVEVGGNLLSGEAGRSVHNCPEEEEDALVDNESVNEETGGCRATVVEAGGCLRAEVYVEGSVSIFNTTSCTKVWTA